MNPLCCLFFFFCSMVSVECRADDIYQRVDSWSSVSKVENEKQGENMRGGEMVLKVRDPSISHICFCNMTASLENLRSLMASRSEGF